MGRRSLLIAVAVTITTLSLTALASAVEPITEGNYRGRLSMQVYYPNHRFQVKFNHANVKMTVTTNSQLPLAVAVARDRYRAHGSVPDGCIDDSVSTQLFLKLRHGEFRAKERPQFTTTPAGIQVETNLYMGRFLSPELAIFYARQRSMINGHHCPTVVLEGVAPFVGLRGSKAPYSHLRR